MTIQLFLQRLSPTPPPISTGDLKSLEQFVNHHPWCGIGQQLLLEGLQQSGEKQLNKQKAKAAIYVVNRERLYQRVQHIKVQEFTPADTPAIEQEEYITLDLSPSAPEPKPVSPQPKKQEAGFYNPLDYFAGENIEPEISDADPISKFLTEKPQLRPVASALNEIGFSEGASSHDDGNSINQLNFNDMVTETLAKIYEDQGLVSLAMATYEKLCLLEPKKNTYFAARIQNLKFKSKS